MKIAKRSSIDLSYLPSVIAPGASTNMTVPMKCPQVFLHVLTRNSLLPLRRYLAPQRTGDDGLEPPPRAVARGSR